MTITPRIFRQFILMSVALGLVGGIADKIFSAQIPDAIREANEKYVTQATAQLPTWMFAMFAMFAVASLVALIGLYRFKPWARTWNLALTGFAFVVSLCMPQPYDYSLSSAVGSAFGTLATLLDGAILAIAYFVPSISARFEAGVG